MRVEGMTHRTVDSLLSVAKNWGHTTTKTTYWYCPQVKWAARWIFEEQQYPSAPWVKSESVLSSYVRAP
jgi:hypothetical protein